MKAKRIHENIIFESPALCTRSQLLDKQGCENSKCLDGCHEVQQLMKKHYIEEGIYLIDNEEYYSIWAYKLKFVEELSEMVHKIAMTVLEGKKKNYSTYNFIFNSRFINEVDEDIITTNLEVPFALCRRDLYKESDSSTDLRKLFRLKDLNGFYDDYYNWVFNNSEEYTIGLEEYQEKSHAKLFT